MLVTYSVHRALVSSAFLHILSITCFQPKLKYIPCPSNTLKSTVHHESVLTILLTNLYTLYPHYRPIYLLFLLVTVCYLSCPSQTQLLTSSDIYLHVKFSFTYPGSTLSSLQAVIMYRFHFVSVPDLCHLFRSSSICIQISVIYSA